MEYLNNDSEGYDRLVNAIILETVRDYVSALRTQRDVKSHNLRAERTIEDCERFFTKDISYYSDEDGEVIMKMIKDHLDDIDITRLSV